MDRQYYNLLWKDISSEKSMVFLSGPRQCGKTTFAKSLLAGYANSVYANWDIARDKKIILSNPSFFENLERRDTSTPLVVLDEIHKYRKWKNYLKGVYDGNADNYHFLILGSGRLNVYRKGGDSLAGRYFEMSLFPLTLAELSSFHLDFNSFQKDPLIVLENETAAMQNSLEQLEMLSGFPEPFLSGRKSFFLRWETAYGRQLIREDLRDATQIRQIDQVELLYSILPSKVGSPLSNDNLAQDLQTSGPTIRTWIETFEALFIIFRLTPWTSKISRSVTRERKAYFYNPALIDSPGPRLENIVALELYRAISSWNDRGLGRFSLHYLRNRDKEEVDFLVADNRKPLFMVEVKASDTSIPASLKKFQNMLQIPGILLTGKPGVRQIHKNGLQNILVISASHWLAGLP